MAGAVSASALEVKIVDPEGAPLGGARITVIGRAGSVVADRDGRARLQPDPEPPFTLFVARPDGVALKPVTIAELSGDSPLVVTVEPAGETVTVVSGAVPDLELSPGAAITVLGRADLTQRLPESLPLALENVPGAGHTGDGLSAVPGLRGLPKHRTLLLLDEGRVTAERRAGASATFLDPLTVDEIEVVRGPGAVAYGSDAFGGIVRMRSRMPSPGSDVELRYGLVAGGAASERGAAAELTVPGIGGGLLLGGHFRSFEDYASPEGDVPDSSGERYGARAAWQGTTGGGVLRIGWRSDLARDICKPAQDGAAERVVYPEEDSHRFHVAFERPGPWGWERVSATAAWDSYRLVLDRERRNDTGQPSQLDSSEVDANDYALRLEGERRVGEARLVVGVDGSGRYDLRAVNRTSEFSAEGQVVASATEVSIASARRNAMALFASLGRDWASWGCALGVRGDRVRASNSGGFFGADKVSNGALSGFVGLSWRPRAGLEVTAQAARGFRDALLSDRYYRGLTGRGFITGNPELEPETSRQFDLAVRWWGERWQIAAFGYLYQIQDLIERYRNADEFLFRNRAEAEIRGAELEGRVALAAELWLELGAHLVRGEVREDRSFTDDVPAPGVFVVLRSDPSRRWWWMVRAAAFDRHDRPGPNEQEVPGYGVLDGAVGWRVAEGLELQLLARNLLDHSHLASADEDAVLAPGRSLQLALRGRL
jgi:iron complex outermembrane receptor protein